MIRHFLEQEKPVAQQSHALLALLAAGMLQRKRTAAYRALDPDIKVVGA